MAIVFDNRRCRWRRRCTGTVWCVWMHWRGCTVGCHARRHAAGPELAPLAQHVQSRSGQQPQSEPEAPAEEATADNMTVSKELVVDRFRQAEARVTQLQKGPRGFQFVIKGSAPVIISSVDPGGVAEAAQLREGDAIVRFNGENVELLSKDQMVGLIVKAGTSAINLEVKNLQPLVLEQIREALSGEIL